MTDPRANQVPPISPRFSLAALLGYVTAVAILLGLVRVAMYEFYPEVIRVPAGFAAYVLFGALLKVLEFWVSAILDSMSSSPKNP